MIKIYKITKPSDAESIYIGKTTEESLNERLANHHYDSSTRQNLRLYQWLDKTCIIELLCECLPELSNLTEMTYIKHYKTLGMDALNDKDGRQSLNPIEYQKIKNSQYIAVRDKDYHNWNNRMFRAAKKEGLTLTEYKLKYNLTYPNA